MMRERAAAASLILTSSRRTNIVTAFDSGNRHRLFCGRQVATHVLTPASETVEGRS